MEKEELIESKVALWTKSSRELCTFKILMLTYPRISAVQFMLSLLCIAKLLHKEGAGKFEVAALWAIRATGL